MTQIQTVFFDIGDTLAVAKFTAAGKLKSLHPLPGVIDVLRRLRDAGLQLGIISNTGDETAESMRHALVKAGLFEYFREPLLIYSSGVGLTKDSPEIFRLACQRATAAPALCLFVGEKAEERQFAAEAGMPVAATPSDAAAAVTH